MYLPLCTIKVIQHHCTLALPIMHLQNRKKQIVSFSFTQRFALMYKSNINFNVKNNIYLYTFFLQDTHIISSRVIRTLFSIHLYICIYTNLC